MLLAGGRVWGEGNELDDRTDTTPVVCNPQMAIVMPLESHSSTAFSHRLGLYYEDAVARACVMKDIQLQPPSVLI